MGIIMSKVNSVFLERSATLGRLAMGLTFEKVSGDAQEYPTAKDFLEFLRLENIRAALRSDWLVSNVLRKEAEDYMKCLHVDIYSLDSQFNCKTKEQHLYAMAPLCKGFEQVSHAV